MRQTKRGRSLLKKKKSQRDVCEREKVKSGRERERIEEEEFVVPRAVECN